MTCPACGQSSRHLFERRNQSGSVHMRSDYTMDLRLDGCPSCQFVWNAEAFADPMKFESWITSAYRNYRLLSDDMHEFPLIDPRSEMALSFLEANCDLPRMHDLLEVGSNRGDFSAYIKSRHPHFNILGVESSPLPKVGIPTIFDDFRNVSNPAAFDLIAARQVLEHIPDPTAFLRHASTFLREGGSLFLEVPDLENDLEDRIDPWVMEHVGHYSEKALSSFGKQAGLQLVAVDRSYQLMALFRKGDESPEPNPENHGRWEKIEGFRRLVDSSQAEWREMVRKGYGLCFYGASNVFLAVTGVLKELWQADWHSCRKYLIDDYPHKHASTVGGLTVQSWENFQPGTACIFVVCAMYRYHRRKMVPKVIARLREQDRLYTMWSPASPASGSVSMSEPQPEAHNEEET